MTEQPTLADVGELASHLNLKTYKSSLFILRKRLGKGKGQQGWWPPENGPGGGCVSLTISHRFINHLFILRKNKGT